MFLNCHTFFSLLYGTLSPERLLLQLKAKGVDSFVLADINNTSGCIQISSLVYSKPEYNGMNPILGIDFRNGTHQKFIGIARNGNGFQLLNRFLSDHLKAGDPLPDTCPVTEDVFVIYPFDAQNDYNLQEHEFIGVKHNQLHIIHQKKWKDLQHKMVILFPITFVNDEDYKIHKILRAIDLNTISSKLDEKELAVSDECVPDEQYFANIFRNHQQLISNTSQLIKNCNPVDFGFHIPPAKRKSKNKAYWNEGINNDDSFLKDNQQLRDLAYKGLKKRYPIITDQIIQRVEKELDIIKKMNFVSYFLINWDIISFARKNGYYYVGRGSGANSIIAYCLYITDVDPIELDLYFERFINLFRKSPPDFDIDFSWKDRDHIIDYIFEKHGTEHTCLQATYTTFQTQSGIRELGKVYGLPKIEIEELINRTARGNFNGLTGFQKEIISYVQKIKDFPRHLSIHASGILISQKPIFQYTATSHPPKGYPICQFDMQIAEDLCLHKFDILSQRGLGHIKETIEIVKKNRGIDIDIHRIDDFKKDPKIIKHLKSGHTMGCFYVESPAMRMLLAKLKCDNYLVLVAASSIIRPGVAQSGMMREYILRHNNPKRRKDAHPVMWEIMPDTYGIMVYQEDVIKVASKFANLKLDEADILRRGMSGKFRSRDEFIKVKNQYFKNCQQLNYPDELAHEVWRQIESFAGFSFAKGHSASFAVESYQSLYLKAHFPLEFMVGVINNSGGFYRTEFYVQEARRCGGIVELPCINNSEFLTIIKDKVIYLGLLRIAGMEQNIHEIILERTNNGLFTNLEDFVLRTSITIDSLIILIRVGTFRFTGNNKQQLLWQAYTLFNKTTRYSTNRLLFKPKITPKHSIPNLHYDYRNDQLDELELLGFTIEPPFKLIAKHNFESIEASEIKKYVNQQIKIIGQLVTIKSTKTRNMQYMYFGTFLDQHGYWIDTVHFPPIADKYPFKGAGCYYLEGKITEEYNFYTLEVSYMEKLGWWNAVYDVEPLDQKVLLKEIA